MRTVAAWGICLAILAVAERPGAADRAPVNSCITCHENRKVMSDLGFPHFAQSREEVEVQTGMPASCPACHLGHPDEEGKDRAHQGLRRLIIVKKKGLKGETAERRHPLQVEQKGDPSLASITMAMEKNGKMIPDAAVQTVLYHDKSTPDLSHDFVAIDKSCGACHPKQVAEFRRSAMGSNAKQSRYTHWSNKETGPHNCGAWFQGNYDKIAAETAAPFSPDMGNLNQRSCNTCHVGCLDCHYVPTADSGNPRDGMHRFVRRPPPQSCYGGGRGVLCHAGPEERRRGAGYFGGTYSFPEGAAADIHLQKGVGCLDCHDSSITDKNLGHGVVKRQGRCDTCHKEAVKSHGQSVHRTLSCEACHITDVGGYQATFWGPGKMAGTETPFVKFKDYYGIMKYPILIKDQKGRWIPVKPYPMGVMNQKRAIDLKPGLYWRYPTRLPDLKRTDDAWGYVGLKTGLPENNGALLWIQMDKVSHKYGKSRGCESCHGSADGNQRQEIMWEYSDAGAFPFRGRHAVVGDKKGLAIIGMKGEEAIEPSDGYQVSSFAPWTVLEDAWRIPGNFALPPLKNKDVYEAGKVSMEAARKLKLLHR